MTQYRPEVPRGPFRGDPPSTKYITSSLFFDYQKFGETSRSAPRFCHFLLFSEDDKIKNGKMRYSLKKIYMDLAYPGNDYDFAKEIFGDYKQWELIKRAPVSGKQIKKWEEELALKYEAIAIKQMVELAKEPNSKNFPAYKYLLDKGYLGKRGRPSKEERAKKLEEIAEQDAELQEDIALLKVIQGGKK